MGSLSAGTRNGNLWFSEKKVVKFELGNRRKTYQMVYECYSLQNIGQLSGSIVIEPNYQFTRSFFQHMMSQVPRLCVPGRHSRMTVQLGD